MNDNVNNKIFLYIVLFFNGVFLYFIIQEIVRYNNNLTFENQIQKLEKDLRTLDENPNYRNLTTVKERYNKFYPNFNSENRLQDFLTFLENTTLKNSLIMQDVQFPISNSYESISKVELKGTVENYYNFIVDLEKDRSIKEVITSKIEMEAGQPILFLEIRSYKF